VKPTLSHPAYQAQQPHGHVLRYTLHERLTHWVATGSFLYLMFTGLAFWSPWLFWIAVVLGGGQVSRVWHPWAGVVFTASVLYMYAMWAAQMRYTKNDKVWWGSLHYYVTNQDDKMPPAGRYNAGQKFLFWGFFWCGILLLFTGFVLWFPEWIPWPLRFLRDISVFVHPAAALLTIGLLMIHIYMGVFVERGAFGSVIRGDVSAAFAKRYHPEWYEEIMGTTDSRK
jgi:formate dehydrogenase subunit gamma